MMWNTTARNTGGLCTCTDNGTRYAVRGSRRAAQGSGHRAQGTGHRAQGAGLRAKKFRIKRPKVIASLSLFVSSSS
jgi:hypothetical protein